MSKKRKKKKANGGRIVKLTYDQVIKELATGKIRQAPIRHASFPPAFLQHLKRVYHWVGKFFVKNETLEQWEIGFMREMNPANELTVWVCVGLAADRLCSDETQRSAVVEQLVLASMGAKNDVKQQYDAISDAFRGGAVENIWKHIPTNIDA